MDKITIERETLLPCPFCGANAEILTIPEDHPEAGAMFVQCCDSRCMTSSALLYPLMDDVRALLVERWNRRAALAAQPAEAQQEPVAWQEEALGGWKEATIGWSVCASVHLEWAKGKDGVFKTRQADFVRHENDARSKYTALSAAQPAPAAVPPDERIRVLREALEVAKNGLGWWQESCPELVTECDHEAMAQIDAALEATK